MEKGTQTACHMLITFWAPSAFSNRLRKTNYSSKFTYFHTCVCVCVCENPCVFVCVREVHVCVYVSGSVFVGLCTFRICKCVCMYILHVYL